MGYRGLLPALFGFNFGARHRGVVTPRTHQLRGFIGVSLMSYRLKIVAGEHNSPVGSVAISGTASPRPPFLALRLQNRISRS